MISYPEIRLVQHGISVIERCSKGKHDGHHNGRQNDDADYLKTLPGSAFLFLLFFSLFHSPVVSGYDLVALFLCLFFLRHVSSPPCISQTGIIPEKCEAIVNAGRIHTFSCKFLPWPRLFRTYSQYITLSEMLQHINALFCTTFPRLTGFARRPSGGNPGFLPGPFT